MIFSLTYLHNIDSSHEEAQKDPEIARHPRGESKNKIVHDDLPLVYETRPRLFRDIAHRLWKLLNFSAYYRVFF